MIKNLRRKAGGRGKSQGGGAGDGWARNYRFALGAAFVRALRSIFKVISLSALPDGGVRLPGDFFSVRVDAREYGKRFAGGFLRAKAKEGCFFRSTPGDPVALRARSFHARFTVFSLSNQYICLLLFFFYRGSTLNLSKTDHEPIS